MAIIKKTRWQVLGRIWRKGNPCTLLVGIQIGAASMENNIGVPQKFLNTTTTGSSNQQVPEEIFACIIHNG